jgi:hypothetical protein
MPYRYEKQGDQYVVYKKDSGKRVGATAGNKEALKKYLAALHTNEQSLTEWRKPKIKDLDHDIQVKIRTGRFAGANGTIHDFQLTDSGKLDGQIAILVDKPGKPLIHFGINDIMIENTLRENEELGIKPYEGSMAKSDAALAAQYAYALHKMIQRDIDLPEWVEAKITKAKYDLQTATEYMYAELTGLTEDLEADKKKAAKLRLDAAKLQTKIAAQQEKEAAEEI